MIQLMEGLLPTQININSHQNYTFNHQFKSTPNLSIFPKFIRILQPPQLENKRSHFQKHPQLLLHLIVFAFNLKLPGTKFLQIKKQMITKISSQAQIAPQTTQQNVENQEELNSNPNPHKSKSHTDKSNSKSSHKPLSRKQKNVISNFELYKEIKRRPQDKFQRDIDQNKMEQPPKYPPNQPPQQLKYSSRTTDIPSSQDHPSLPSLIHNHQLINQSPEKFKKKAMSKQEIIEVKEYVRSLEIDKCQTNSVAVSQKSPENEPQARNKDLTKKSKTQYYNIQQIHGSMDLGDYISENSSQSQGIYIASLREKCKSVDNNNCLLEKRLKWLMEQIEVHLERQILFQKEKEKMNAKMNEKNELLQQMVQQNKQLKKQLDSKTHQICKLRQFVIELNLKFQNDREILINQIEYLKSQKWVEIEEKEEAYEKKIKELSQQIQLMETENHKNKDFTPQNYSQALLQKLVNENKYLKMENHMLARYKEDMIILKRQNKQIANERDGFKKKIIENAKKEAMKFRMMEDSDSSSFMELSDLSLSIPRCKQSSNSRN